MSRRKRRKSSHKSVSPHQVTHAPEARALSAVSLTRPGTDLPRQINQTRWNPLSSATPQVVGEALDGFKAGYLRGAGILWEAIAERDDMVKTAMPKRLKAVSCRPWEIVLQEDTPAARSHKEVLERFFNHITVTDSTDLNVVGSMRLLIKQMMLAQFHRYAVHEIVWKPGQELRAELKHCPIWLFENTRGRLGYIGAEHLTEGALLKSGEWMTTCGDGLMEAITVCWMFKRLSLQDWLAFSQRFGMPGLHGECTAPPGSDEWHRFIEALHAFANDWVIATSPGGKINLIEAGKNGDGPFGPMVERMDRSIAALCRGADLSTLSRADGAGASLQGDEANILMLDDCELISESINLQLTRQVIAHQFGEEPLAYFQLNPPSDQSLREDMLVDDHLAKHRVPLAPTDLAERYGRTLPDADEQIVLGGKLANEQSSSFGGVAKELLSRARQEDLAPLMAELREILTLEDGPEMDRRLSEMVATLPDMISADVAQQQAWEAVLGTAWLNGAATDLQRL